MSMIFLWGLNIILAGDFGSTTPTVVGIVSQIVPEQQSDK